MKVRPCIRHTLSWSNLWSQSQSVDLVLLPYYLLIHVWLTVSGSIAWVARTVPSRILRNDRHGWLDRSPHRREVVRDHQPPFSATSTLLVEKSLEPRRPYELSTLLVTLSALFLVKWLDDPRLRWVWWFCGLTLLATAMQLFSLLAPASMLIGVLVIRPN